MQYLKKIYKEPALKWVCVSSPDDLIGGNGFGLGTNLFPVDNKNSIWPIKMEDENLSFVLLRNHPEFLEETAILLNSEWSKTLEGR